MRAYENVSIYCEIPEAVHRKRMKQHQERIKNAQPVLKLSSPGKTKQSPRATSPKKGQERLGEIAKNNMILARRIFNIMEGPGIITNLMESSVTENHPGTINFSHRLAEAKRIHHENMTMASRLDSVKAYYDTTSIRQLTTAKNARKKRVLGGSTTKKRNKRDNSATASGRVVLGKNALKINSDFVESRSEDSKRPRNVLLEYTKIQKGRVLDVAVIKEPFRDSYSIFGIDIDNGQRYELRLTSEEVSNILEGDILVTSVDNVEVWMALLNKVELRPVDAFAKLPVPASSSRGGEAVPLAKPGPQPEMTPEENESDCAVGEAGIDSMTDLSTHQDKGDSMSQEEGYTLDDYYEANVPLSPLPPQQLAGAGTGNGEEYGELLDATFFDRMAAGDSAAGERPSARSGTARAVSRQHSGRDEKSNVRKHSGVNLDEGVAPTAEQMQNAQRTAASISTAYCIETALRNVLLKKHNVQQSKDKEGGKKPPPLKHNHISSKPAESPVEPKKEKEKEKEKDKDKEPVRPTEPRVSAAPAPKPPNPYTSTRVTAAPRSKSIRYTQVPQAGAAAGNNQQDQQEQLQQQHTQKPAGGATRRSILKKAPEVASDKTPQPPQGSQPSKKPHHRQTKVSKTNADVVVSETRSLAEKMAADYIKTAQANVDGLVLLTTMKTGAESS
jgi:hypothetical protein